MTLKVQICGCCDFVQPLEPGSLLRRLADDPEDSPAFCQHNHCLPGDNLTVNHVLQAEGCLYSGSQLADTRI